MLKKIVAIVLSLTMALSVAPLASPVKAASKSAYKTVAEAGVEARNKIYNHKTSFSVKVKSKNAEPQSVSDALEKVIYAETSNPNQGDYMRWDVDETELNYTGRKSGAYCYYTFTYNISYLTSISERKKLDSKVKSVIKGFKFTKKTSTYAKIKKVYDYICKNTTYASSNSNPKVYSAYSALIKKKAVCQGYATLLYKMLRTMGISTRVIAGDSSFSNSHGWNIVKLGSLYYNVDATWDSTLLHSKKSYKYFLKGDSFKGHTRWKEYKKTSFYATYPMAAKAYNPKVAAKMCTTSKIAKFKNKKAKIKYADRIKINAKKVKGARYQFKYSSLKSFKKANSRVIKQKKKTYYFKSLAKGVTYYAKVRAYKKINGVTYYTKWSAVKTI